jgi:uncharacterized membrane protein
MVKNNGLAAISYVFGILSGILVFLVAEKKDKLVRFHAAQSIFFSISVAIIGLIIAIITMFAFGGIWMWGMSPMIAGPFAMISMLIWAIYCIIIFVMWLFLILKAYSGQIYKLPLIGGIAEDIAK